MPGLNLKPTHQAVIACYHLPAQFASLGVKHETAVRSAFQELLERCARQFEWKLVPEYRIKRKGHADVSADGAVLDKFGLNHGLWEAKDSADDLDQEIKRKFAAGYPKQNIIFWQPDRAVLYQNGEIHSDKSSPLCGRPARISGWAEPIYGKYLTAGIYTAINPPGKY